MKRLIPTLLVLLLAVLACSIPILPTEPPIVTEPPVSEPPVTEPPVTEPPILIEPPLPSVLVPSGFVVTPNTTDIQFYSADGFSTGSLTPGVPSYTGFSFLHVAGGTSGGVPLVIYFNWRESAQIIQHLGGVETVLVVNPDFNRMRGAEASNYFAYTTATYSDAGLRTQLFVGTPATIGGAPPVIDETVTDGQGLKPLALRMEGGVATGVWTTGCMYGIGGDLVFDPCNRVSFIDLGTGVRTELVGDGFNPSELSPDHTWVAYAQPGGGMPLIIRNLETGENYSFPAWALNDRGSGDGVFSPDSQTVAWMEGSGYRMDTPFTFRSMVRVGTTGGVLVGDFPADYFNTTAGFTVVWAEPVGWLDNDSVLIQVADMDWTNHCVIRLDLPGTLIYLANGIFVGLTYP
jgi:hypothetical protein